MSDPSLSPDPIAELEAQTTALEKDNALLRQRLAQFALLGELAEGINLATSSDGIVAAAVERLAQSCALCALGHVRTDGIEVVATGASSTELVGAFISIPGLEARLQSEMLVLEAEQLDVIGWPSADATPSALRKLVFVPISLPRDGDGAFVIGHDADGEPGELTQILERAVAMVAIRLNAADLVTELGALNDELEQYGAELRTTNAELAHAEARYRNLAQSVGDPYYVTAPTGAIIDANERACTELGYTRTELTALNVWDIDSSFDLDEVEHTIDLLARGESPVRDGFQRRRDGTTFPVEVTMSLMQSDPEPNVLCLVRDVSERARLEQELWQARKMESIGRLAGGIAHDFNNLLSTIIGHSDLALADLPESHPVGDSVRSIKEAGHRAAELTQQLLAFSRKQALETKPVSLGEVVSNLSRILKRIIGDDIDLEMDMSTQPSAIMGDQSQLEQVILNLVVNARDAMPGGGRLTVRTQIVDLDEGAVATYGIDEPGRYVMLCVQDEGIGIGADIQDEIFEPFFTTKAAGKGTGLGLSTTYGIVRQFRGGIRVLSELGRGTTFEVVFPVSPEEVPVDDDNHPEGETLPTGHERLLVVDDHPGVRGMLSRTLARLGYSVVQASDGEEAIRILEADALNIDLVVSDVVMPGIQGTRLAAEIENRFPDVTVMLMTGYAPDGLPALQALKRRPRVLSKPISPRELALALREVLAEREARHQKT